MATVNLDFASPAEYLPREMSACTANRPAKGNGNFLHTFGNTATNTRSVDALQPRQRSRPRSGLGLKTDDSTIFDVDPRPSSNSPYPSQFSDANASGVPGWINDMSYHPLSPPDSGSYSPKEWPFGFQQSNSPNNLASKHPKNTWEHYGQVTPPDDQNDHESIFDHRLREQLHQERLHDESASAAKKRKRNSPSRVDVGSQPSKRTRKYASRGSTNSDLIDPTKPEDVRRSKFLERNRVAASKCRQKKKEWTQNLENRARELQKNNASLRMMLESLRQEILFLKGEMIRHNNCGCTQIQEFLKSGANTVQDLSEQDFVFKRESSPAETMPPSRLGNRGRDGESRRSSSSNLQASYLSGDEDALEALLTSSINHDTSDEGIASQMNR